MDFTAGGLVEMFGGLSCAIVPPATRGGRRSCSAAPALDALALRESGLGDRNTEEVRAAQRDADCAYRSAVDPPASKELRLFGLDD